MVKIAKKAKSNFEKFDKTKTYSLEEASGIVKDTATAKFDETIELTVKLNVNPKKADQNIRSTVVLPHGTGKTKRIAVIAKGEKINEAKKAGADIFGAEDLITEIKSGKMDFDVLVSTPDMMKDMAKLGKVLGPKGLMPSPKAGTVTFDLEKVIKEIKLGKIEFRVDSYGIMHSGIGKASFDKKQIFENAMAIITIIKKIKPMSVKGKYIQKISLSSTMGPGVFVDITT